VVASFYVTYGENVYPTQKEASMIKKRILKTDRMRRISGGFSFIPHRFLTDGFLAGLDQTEILLYTFLILASDRFGLSFYSYDSICNLLKITLDQYTEARNGLIKKDLIAFDGTIFQVLELPLNPPESLKPDYQEAAFVKQFTKQAIKEF
jgi:hypothetical protein